MEDRATVVCRPNMQKNGEDRTCSSEDMIADRKTHTDRHTQTRSSQYSGPLSGAEYIMRQCSMKYGSWRRPELPICITFYCQRCPSMGVQNVAMMSGMQAIIQLCSNGSDSPHHRGVTPLLRAIGCAWRTYRPNASASQEMSGT